MLENIENTAVCPSFFGYVSVFIGNPKKLGHLLLSNVRPNKGRCILYSNYIISMLYAANNTRIEVMGKLNVTINYEGNETQEEILICNTAKEDVLLSW